MAPKQHDQRNASFRPEEIRDLLNGGNEAPPYQIADVAVYLTQEDFEPQSVKVLVDFYLELHDHYAAQQAQGSPGYSPLGRLLAPESSDPHELAYRDLQRVVRLYHELTR